MLNREEIAKKIAEELTKEVKNAKILDRDKIEKIKVNLCRKYKCFIKNSEIIKYVRDERTRELLRLKPQRSYSGVHVVAIMTRPFKCPHGKCIYCPGGVDFNTPQSYTGKEPACLRAIQYNYNPYLQFNARVNQYFSIGHDVEKVEVIVMGGTFLSFPRWYKEEVIKGIFAAANYYPKIVDKKKYLNVPLKVLHEENENAKIRIVALTIETRPDFAKEKEALEMLDYGVTRVEIGAQTVFDDVLEYVNRGHTVKDTIEATRILKDFGFKVTYHMMLNLPLMDFERDLKAFKILFENENFRPDGLKIYPTLVIKGTQLYNLWKKGKFRVYSERELIELLKEIYKVIPEYVRVMRVNRDIPSTVIDAGIKKSNLRQIVQEELEKEKVRIREIRYREISRKKLTKESKIELVERKYKASNGIEYFLSFEDVNNDAIIALLRLRFPSNRAPKIFENAALIRELHVYGDVAKIGKKGKWQHRGFGKSLVERAEEIAREKGFERIFVISGVGVRKYYYKLGYKKVEGFFHLMKEL